MSDIARRDTGFRRAAGTSRGERWFRSLVQNASDIVAILKADGAIRYVSPAVERILGYRPEEIVGTSALDYVHPEDLEFVAGGFAKAVENAWIPN